MPLEDVTDRIRKKVAQGVPITARFKFDFGDDGRIFVDSTQTPPVISNDDESADVTLLCSLETFTKLMDGAQDPNVAFLMGKLKVQGSMGLAMKLNAMLED